jgi:hypothetical protein
MSEKTILGDWFIQMEKVSAYRKMSNKVNGIIVLSPSSYVESKWAEAIKIRLNKDGFDKVQIRLT